MGVAHVGLVHRDPCECKVKGFRAVSSIERNVSNRRHLQGVRHERWREGETAKESDSRRHGAEGCISETAEEGDGAIRGITGRVGGVGECWGERWRGCKKAPARSAKG